MLWEKERESVSTRILLTFLVFCSNFKMFRFLAICFVAIVICSNVNCSPIPTKLPWEGMKQEPTLNRFRESLLSENFLDFLEDCYNGYSRENINNILCPIYFEMILRVNETGQVFNLSKNAAKQYMQKYESNTVESFCGTFVTTLPTEQKFFINSTDLHYSILKTQCQLLCKDIQVVDNQAKEIVKPICAWIQWGYDQLPTIAQNQSNHSSANTVSHHKIDKNPPSLGSNVSNDATVPNVATGSKPKPLVKVEKEESANADEGKPENEDEQKTSNIQVIGSPKNVNKQPDESILDEKMSENLSPVKNVVEEKETGTPKQPKLVTNTKQPNTLPAGITITDRENAGYQAPKEQKYKPEITSMKATKTLDDIQFNIPPQLNNQNEDIDSEHDDNLQTGDRPKVGPETYDDPDEEVYPDEHPGDNKLQQLEKDVGQLESKYRSEPQHKESNLHPPEEPFFEDSGSNFFTYFLFAMFASILLYVVYHNKTKILALILEGRRSQNGRGVTRRKHTAAYRKLDTNLEEAMASPASGRTTQIIY